MNLIDAINNSISILSNVEQTPVGKRAKLYAITVSKRLGKVDSKQVSKLAIQYSKNIARKLLPVALQDDKLVNFCQKLKMKIQKTATEDEYCQLTLENVVIFILAAFISMIIIQQLFYIIARFLNDPFVMIIARKVIASCHSILAFEYQVVCLHLVLMGATGLIGRYHKYVKIFSTTMVAAQTLIYKLAAKGKIDKDIAIKLYSILASLNLIYRTVVRLLTKKRSRAGMSQ